MLLIVGWSAVVVWLNVRPRVYELEASRVEHRSHPTEDNLRFCFAEFGYPWTCVNAHHGYYDESIPDPTTESAAEWLLTSFKPSNAVPPDPSRSDYAIHYWPLAGNVAIGLLAVAGLTLASKYLARAIATGARAVLSKPPLANEKGPERPS